MTDETRVVNRPAPPPNLDREPSIGPLLRELAQDSSALIRQEIALAKAEVRQSVSQVTNGAVKLGIAAALLAVAGLVMTAFLVLLLGELLDSYWISALIVGVVFALTGAVLALSGISRLKEVQMAPEATLQTLKEDGAWAKEEVQELKRELTS